jgi:adenine phosphoribosyltransferase
MAAKDSHMTSAGSASPQVADRFLKLIRDVPDFPVAGVVFKDLIPLLGDPEAFGAVVGALRDVCSKLDVTKAVGLEARGFILAAPVAVQAGVGFVPVRKAGKLPGATYSQSYELEYGSGEIEVQQDAFSAGDRVLIIDDVLATGGTVEAAMKVVRSAGAQVAGVAVLLELGFLGGRARLEPLLGAAPLESLVLL